MGPWSITESSRLASPRGLDVQRTLPSSTLDKLKARESADGNLFGTGCYESVVNYQFVGQSAKIHSGDMSGGE